MGLPFYDHNHDAEAYDYDIDYILDDYREHELNDEFHLAASAADHIDYHDHSPRAADRNEYNDCGPDE